MLVKLDSEIVNGSPVYSVSKLNKEDVKESLQPEVIKKQLKRLCAERYMINSRKSNDWKWIRKYY